MTKARALLMFSSEARAFRRSGDPRLVRTSPSDTLRNSIDNSLSLRFCSSWFEISFMFSSLCCGPAHRSLSRGSVRPAGRRICQPIARSLGAVYWFHRTYAFGQRASLNAQMRGRTEELTRVSGPERNIKRRYTLAGSKHRRGDGGVSKRQGARNRRRTVKPDYGRQGIHRST
jgi:hypothetical protein